MGIDNLKELQDMGKSKTDKKDPIEVGATGPVHPDWAPDADEPGDPADEATLKLVHEGEIVPDQVDAPSEVTE